MEESLRGGRSGWVGASLAASVPTVGYALAYAYEKAYADTLGFPKEFISISFADSFFTAGLTFFFGFILFVALDGLIILMNPPSEKIRMLLFSGIPVYLLALFSFLLLENHWEEWAPILVLSMIHAFVIFGLPVVTRRDISGYYAKLEATYHRLGEPYRRSPRSLFGKFILRYGIAPVFIAMAFSSAMFLSIKLGKAHALQNDLFPIISGSPEKVILRIYSGRAVVTTLDRRKREIGDSYSFIDLSADSAPIIKIEKIGPLRKRDVRR